MLATYVRRLFIVTVAGTVLAAVSCSSSPAKRPGTGGAGSTGTAGTTGAAGTAGSTDTAGTTGAAGDTGAAGTTGAAGDTGVAGTTGAAGSTNTAGTTGAAGATGAAGDTGAAGTTQPPVDNTPTIPLPITVTANWFPSGYYGDSYTQTLFGATDPAMRPITMAVATDGPCAARVAGPVGECWKVTYNPQVMEGGAAGFAGVALLTDLAPGSPNWDMLLKAPRPAQGATMVTAQVAGAAGGEAVNFNVGAQADGATGTQSVVLTKAWQKVTIPLTGSYDHLLSAFGWGSASATPITFYYDNVVLQ